MIIAVTSQNLKTITPHAGKTRRFLLFSANSGQAPARTGTIDLPMGMAFHDFKGDGAHPLDQVNAIVTASAGEHFVTRMAERGIVVAITDQTDPDEAVRQFLAGKLGQAGGEDACGCSGHTH